jgi:hypothetical protein
MHLKKSLLFGCYLFFAMCLSSIAFAKTQKEYQENYEMCVKANSSLVDAPYECALATTGASEQNVVHVFEALQERFKQSAPDRLDALMEMHAFWIDYSKRYCRLLSDDKSVWAHCQMRLQLMYLDELNRLKDD